MYRGRLGGCGLGSRAKTGSKVKPVPGSQSDVPDWDRNRKEDYWVGLAGCQRGRPADD